MNAEIADIRERWSDGLISDGEALTLLVAIQSQALDTVALVTLRINEEERRKAEAMLKA